MTDNESTPRGSMNIEIRKFKKAGVEGFRLFDLKNRCFFGIWHETLSSAQAHKNEYK